MNYRTDKKLKKLRRLLTELDIEQAEFDRHSWDAAENVRWARIFISKAIDSLRE